jgi:hypothetical protein
MALCEICKNPTDIDRLGRSMEKIYTGVSSHLCQSCRFEIECYCYVDFEFWEDLLRRNIMYLREEIDVTPSDSYWGSITEQVRPNIPGLITLNEYGILTRKSQAFLNVTGYVEVGDTGPKWYQWQQRPYLWFLIPTQCPGIPIRRVVELVDAIFAHPEIDATTWPDTEWYLTVLSGSKDIQVRGSGRSFDKVHRFRSNVTRGVPVVRRNRVADTLPGLYAQAFSNAEFFNERPIIQDAAINMCGFDMEKNTLPIAEMMKPLVIGVVARRFETPLDIQHILVDLCIHAGLTRVFSDITQVVETG